MKTLGHWLDVVEGVNGIALCKIDATDRRRVVARARRVQTSAKKLGTSLSVVPFEGAFLYVCAEYELSVRTLVEDFGSSVSKRVKRYSDLPEKLRNRNVRYSATILNELDRDMFSSLGEYDVVAKLFKCLDPSTPDHSFELCEEAVSYSMRNFKWDIVKDLFGDLGIKDLMSKVSVDKKLQAALGVTTPGLVSSTLPLQLNQIMLQRNRIVHRSKSVAAPTAADVRSAGKLLSCLLLSLNGVLVAHFKAL